MEFLWMKYEISEALSASALLMNLDMQNRLDSSIYHLQTLGGNVFYKKDKLNLTGTYYFQTGNNPQKSLKSVKTNAWMAAFKADYNINKKIGIGVGSDYLSGKNMNSSTSTISFFNPLYGTHHKFYGFMDYFYVSSPYKNVGLWDSYLNINFTPANKFNSQIALHHFESAAKVINYSGSTASSTLGNEADLTFTYTIMKEVKLNGGYSQMFTNSSMKYVKNISPEQKIKPLQNWIWLSLNVNPEMIFSKLK